VEVVVSKDLPAAQPTSPAIKVENVSKTFHRNGKATRAIGNVSFSVAPGEFVSIVGPSGCGKSTFLNLVAGLDNPTEGTVEFFGQKVNGLNKRVGYVTQEDTLLPWRTVSRNVALPLEVQNRSRDEIAASVSKFVSLVNLAGFEDHFPKQLSGGMRRRVTIARTLAYEPSTILMDEPFGALDAQLRLIMQEELVKIWAATNLTILFVTHDISEAVSLSDRVILLSAGPSQVRMNYEIDLPRPRDLMKIRQLPEYGQAQEKIWDALQQDFRRGVDV
jgi:NitT/TauT family transport system ATP-binding protein